ALNRRQEVIEADNVSADTRTTTTTYDDEGNVLSVIDPRQTITSYGYDQVNRRTTMIEAYNFPTPPQRTTVYGYDKVGNLTSLITPPGTIPSTGRAPANRRNLVREAVGDPNVARMTTMLYDGEGNLASVTSGLSAVATYQHNVTTSYGYDALNRRTLVLEAYGTGDERITGTKYDANDNVIKVTDTPGNVTSYVYDQLDQLKTKTEAENSPDVRRTTTYLYDNVRNLTSMTTGQSAVATYQHAVTTTYAYDNLNRRTAVTEAAGVPEDTRTTTTVY